MVSSSTKIKGKLVDYKSDIYEISIGDNYKRSKRTIDWRWACEADSDGHIDSNGKDAFLNLDEPLIIYNDGECLPSLYIETDKNIITLFNCSVFFDLADEANAGTTFLSIISKDIIQLQKKEVMNALIKQGFYEIKTKDFMETFILSKGRNDESDKFEYIIQSR